MSKKRPLGLLQSSDVRDKAYRLEAYIPETTDIESRYWFGDHWAGNQFDTPQCVGFAWAHWIENEPIAYPEPGPKLDPTFIYRSAQRVDEFPGENYDGTTIRAGAKVVKANGHISTYAWTWSAETIARAVLTTGPIVVGTSWFDGMDEPDSDNRIRPTGAKRGAHAYLINGYDSVTQMFRIKNSWGTSWGDHGHAYISYSDLQTAIDDYGEACMAIETRVDGTSPDEPKAKWFVRIWRAIVRFFSGIF